MAAPFRRNSGTQLNERTGTLQQIAGVGPAQVCREVEAAQPPPAVMIAQFPVLGARR
jgi:hypothetical protein